MQTTVRLQREDFDAAAEQAALARGRTDIGAVVSFTGICRGAESGEPIAALTLEHYPDMAEAEIMRHVETAQTRWSLLGVTVIHRYGRIAPGEPIVLVVTTSSHRQDAFAGREDADNPIAWHGAGAAPISTSSRFNCVARGTMVENVDIRGIWRLHH